MFGSQVTDLGGLLVDHVRGVGDVGVDDFAVLDVDEREEVGHGREEQGEAPGRRDLDEEVGDEDCCEGLKKHSMSVHVQA